MTSALVLESCESLATLATTAVREAEAVDNLASEALGHAVACGNALLRARDLVEDGTWREWLKANFSHSHSVATTYMRLAAYNGEWGQARTVKDAYAAIRFLPPLRPPGRAPSISPVTVAKAQALVDKGESIGEAARRAGVGRVTLSRHLRQTRDGIRAAESRSEAKRQARARKRRADNELLARARAAEAVKRTGGSTAHAFEHIRKALQALDKCDQRNPSINEAIRLGHLMEDAIGAAVRESYSTTRAA